jgi:hypothetical protein
MEEMSSETTLKHHPQPLSSPWSLTLTLSKGEGIGIGLLIISDSVEIIQLSVDVVITDIHERDDVSIECPDKSVRIINTTRIIEIEISFELVCMKWLYKRIIYKIS